MGFSTLKVCIGSTSAMILILRLKNSTWLAVCKFWGESRLCPMRERCEFAKFWSQVDPVWTTRPVDPCGDIRVHELEYAGETISSKLL